MFIPRRQIAKYRFMSNHTLHELSTALAYISLYGKDGALLAKPQVL